LWALERCEGWDGARGYPHQSTIYSPARRGDIDMDTATTPVSEDEWELARAIQKGVTALGHVNRDGATILIAWYGASIGASSDRSLRMQRTQMAPRAARDAVKLHKAFVVGWVTAYRQYAQGGQNE